MIARDRVVELDALARVERIARVDGYGGLVLRRLDDVERGGGPDEPAATAIAALRGQHEEAVDGGAWGIVALEMLRQELSAGTIDGFACDEAVMRLTEAMVSFAHAEKATRGALALLGERP